MHCPLEFTQFVGDFVGNIIRRQNTDSLYSVGKVVGDCDISSDYFRTLCEMPTDIISSVWTSVIVAFQVIIFELCEMPTDLSPSVLTQVSVQEKLYLYWLCTFLQTLNDKLSIAQNNNNSA